MKKSLKCSLQFVFLVLTGIIIAGCTGEHEAQQREELDNTSRNGPIRPDGMDPAPSSSGD